MEAGYPMFWKLSTVTRTNEEMDGEAIAPEGRFVLQRHSDAGGPHLDLRLEQDGYLLGWRIDGLSLEEEPWATEKPPHPVRWLEQDGDAVREDEGVYAWVWRDAQGGELELRGRGSVRRLKAARVEGLTPRCIRAIREAMAECHVQAKDAAELVRDGAEARRRAIERFCGLGRELDGLVFDETVWRKTLGALSLKEIHRHLEAYEVRFDQKYPPQPASKPEPLPEEDAEPCSERVMAILRS